MIDNRIHEVVQAGYGAIASGQLTSCCGSSGDCCGDTDCNTELYNGYLVEC
jgi:hypothetical protein